MERFILISADNHAGAPEDGYGPYLEKKYLEQYHDFISDNGAMFHAVLEDIMGGELFPPDLRETFAHEEKVEAGGKTGLWDFDRRMKELEADGIVGDVPFPDFAGHNEPPFNVLEGPGYQPPELQLAGARAYNRWLSEQAAPYRDRIAPIALITVHDIDAAVKEVEWAAKAGMRGGILLQLIPDHSGVPQYHHPRYEPLWHACEEYDMPVQSHPPGGTARYGKGLPGAEAIFATEVMWYSHRPLWLFIWSGILERHPRLKLVFAEQGSDWIPGALQQMDFTYEGPNWQYWSHGMKLQKPSDYWRRQCYVTASLTKGAELPLRHEVGLENMMWGTDYPHFEGTWPHTEEYIRTAFTGVPEHEVRMLMGEIAAKVYNFDLKKLQPLAETIGPPVALAA